MIAPKYKLGFCINSTKTCKDCKGLLGIFDIFRLYIGIRLNRIWLSVSVWYEVKQMYRYRFDINPNRYIGIGDQWKGYRYMYDHIDQPLNQWHTELLFNSSTNYSVYLLFCRWRDWGPKSRLLFCSNSTNLNVCKYL